MPCMAQNGIYNWIFSSISEVSNTWYIRKEGGERAYFAHALRPLPSHSPVTFERTMPHEAQLTFNGGPG